MDRKHFYEMMNGEGTLDYELYLNTKSLLSCQKPFAELCNRDELQFQVVHQVEELWMKLIGYTLLDIDDYLQQENTNRVLTLFRRVHIAQQLMIDQIALLETMSPKEYQEIRLGLGNGSGQESPGFRTLLKMYQPIWNSFKERYLDKHGLTVEKIYNSEYAHGDAYMVAEALAEFDELFQKFRYHHMQLIFRTIGISAKSLKGRPVEILEEGMRQQFFPDLWEIRHKMTDLWGSRYGVKREPLGGHH
ncbi:MAG TPA: tryptophan 2,3-dioxygenase family protein [Candidatus Dormibacteraeota bacterium]|nr:tryptophan 2,3-dioxygenase family protein [Candidatus Dormibacteraeota bacterium]